MLKSLIGRMITNKIYGRALSTMQDCHLPKLVSIEMELICTIPFLSYISHASVKFVIKRYIFITLSFCFNKRKKCQELILQ